MKYSFLRTQRTKIFDAMGREIFLRGVNLGGWLMMEGYFLQAPNIGVRKFKKEFAARLGEKALQDFERAFYSTFIQEEDFKRIAEMKMNCIRLPFHHGLIETAPYRYSAKGVAYLDQAIRWAKKYGLYVILDLHGAAGCQNHDWHSDSLGKAELWGNKNFQKRTAALWEFLADRYRDESTVAGYDLLNEAVIADEKKLNDLYRVIIQAIRSADKNHVLFVEGNKWATDLKCLERFHDHNLALSIHFYHPIDFSFNFVPSLRYPLRYQGLKWDRAMLGRMVASYAKSAKEYGAPIFVGEFGVNDRDNVHHEIDYLKDVLSCFDAHDFHWTYWTYKAVKHTMFPDGLFSYYPNSPWVNRQGPKTGWDTYADLWPRHKKDIIESWKTKYFTPNTKAIKALSSCQA